MSKPQHLAKGLAYTEKYKNQLFEHWFKNGKLGYSKFRKIAFPDENGRLPGEPLIQKWIDDEWRGRGEHLDSMVMEQLNAQLVYEKVEMLKRHADDAKWAQEIAIEKLKQMDIEDFTASALIRLWSEGIRIERESIGIPQALEKMSGLSDEQLVKEIEEIVRSSPGTIEQIDDADNG